MWQPDASATGPVDLPEPVRSTHPLLRLFRYRDDFLLYDAKPHFACVFSQDDVGPLVQFLEGRSLDETRAVGNLDDGRLTTLWRQLERLHRLGALTAGPLAQLAEVDPDVVRRRVRYYDDNIVWRKFCLEVTQDCNFRCRYCPFTVETEGRVHAPIHMSRETAYLAIDYYFERYTRLYSRAPEAKRERLLERAGPFLSWFGGEPLLRFRLVRDSLEYFAAKPWTLEQRRRIGYGITTNLSIFSDEIADFLAAHRVRLYVSLDGPESEHDKNRVFKGGTGTFKTVFGNLQKLRARDPEYFRRYVIIQSVAADNVDVSACAAFFKRVGDPTSGCLGAGPYRPGAAARRGMIVPEAERERTRLDESFDAGVASFRRQLSVVRDLADLERARAANPLFGGQLAQLKDFVRIAESPRSCSPVRRSMVTCPMGFDQLYVAADGKLHMCQLTDGTVALGDVSQGLDHALIAERYLRHNASWNNDDCRACWIVNLCKICAALLSHQGGFCRPSRTECEYLRRSSEQAMCNYLALCERPQLQASVREQIETSYQGQVDVQRL